jgi:hypothetical protein
MSSQIQQEIYQQQARLAQLQRANDVNTSRAYQSMDYGNFNEPMVTDTEIPRLQKYINSLNGVMNMWGNDQQKLQAFNQLKVGYNNPNPRGYGWGGRRRYKKKSVKRGGRKRKTRRNTRRR